MEEDLHVTSLLGTDGYRHGQLLGHHSAWLQWTNLSEVHAQRGHKDQWHRLRASHAVTVSELISIAALGKAFLLAVRFKS